MKAQAALSFFLILLSSPSGCQASFFHLSTMNEQTVIGRLDEDVILPCTFESGPEVVIHWNNQDNKIYKYYKNSDQLENQDARYRNRTSLFHSEIHNGNASLSLRKLSLLDEGIYVCYVGTATRKITHKVVLKVGAFITPAMKYEKRNTNSFLICSVLSVYPRPIITWQVDNIPTSASSMEENGSLGPFYVKSRINITGSNSSYECAIENSLLEQTWTGRWTMKDGLHKMQSENFSLSCEFVNNFFLLNQEFIVTWSRVQSGTSSILGYFLSSSQNTTINEPQLSWKGELINQSDFSLTLKDLGLSDSGEYLCNISSSKYTSLTVQTLHVGLSQRTLVLIIILSLHLVALVLLVICII